MFARPPSVSHRVSGSAFADHQRSRGTLRGRRTTMSKLLLFGCAAAASLLLPQVVNADNGFPHGQHWQFNIIGHPKNVEAISGDDSNGRAIMVPLRNTNEPGQPKLACAAVGGVLNEDLSPTFTDQEPTGAKIYF